MSKFTTPRGSRAVAALVALSAFAAAPMAAQAVSDSYPLPLHRGEQEPK
jgi:hypothetical protein